MSPAEPGTTAATETPEGDTAEVRFRCNICGAAAAAPRSAFGREAATCGTCGSTNRMRSIIHALSMALYGQSMAIGEFPSFPAYRGLGMSDWPPYAERLAAQLDYQNTFLHQEPKLDILAPDPARFGSLDFLISTDVYEHVTPPVQPAFDNAFKLLKPGGVFVFSVPYTLEEATVEHFPELHDFRIEQEGGEYVLYNTTAQGEQQVFRDLVFHGGPGQTLEMRVFTEKALRAHLQAAGFEAPIVYQGEVPECGLVNQVAWSLTWAVRRPAVEAQGEASEGDEDVIFFDQHSRYASVGETLQTLARPGETVLDVGSGEACLLERFVAGLPCTYLDPLLKADRGDKVLAGGFARLREEEHSWDWIVAVDMLEHIPAAERPALIEVMLARSRVGVILSGPYAEDPAALEVDTIVNDTYRSKNGEDYPWLVEHTEFGLPARQEVEAQLREAGLQVDMLGNGHAPWLARLLPLVVCYLDQPEHGPLLRHLSRSFTEGLGPHDHLEPVYRRILVGSRRDLDLSPLHKPQDAAAQAAGAKAWQRFEQEAIAAQTRYADRLLQAAQADSGTRADLVQRLARSEQAERQRARELADVGQQRAELEARLKLLEGSRWHRLGRALGLLR